MHFCSSVREVNPQLFTQVFKESNENLINKNVTYMMQYSIEGFPNAYDHVTFLIFKFKITSSKSKVNNINRFTGHNLSSAINKYCLHQSKDVIITQLTFVASLRVILLLLIAQSSGSRGVLGACPLPLNNDISFWMSYLLITSCMVICNVGPPLAKFWIYYWYINSNCHYHILSDMSQGPVYTPPVSC